jgi:hypothetical protein
LLLGGNFVSFGSLFLFGGSCFVLYRYRIMVRISRIYLGNILIPVVTQCLDEVQPWVFRAFSKCGGGGYLSPHLGNRCASRMS